MRGAFELCPAVRREEWEPDEGRVRFSGSLVALDSGSVFDLACDPLFASVFGSVLDLVSGLAPDPFLELAPDPARDLEPEAREGDEPDERSGALLLAESLAELR